MDIPGPFYRSNSSEKDHIINCLNDCSRKVANKWSERKSSVNVLNVIEDWIKVKSKPDKVINDNGKALTSRIFKHFLVHNRIKDKRILNSYPPAAREDRSI
jgi:hypothetical protein